MENLDHLLTSLFVVVTILTNGYLLYAIYQLPTENNTEVAKCVFSDLVIGLFFGALTVLALFFLFRWQLVGTCLSVLALASTTSCSFSVMSNRARRILWSRHW